jgi:hypothetical protein
LYGDIEERTPDIWLLERFRPEKALATKWVAVPGNETD